jgi:hypothetical protein
VYAEGNYQQTRVENSGATVSYQRLFAGPSLSLNANGSVYHPTLLQYFLRTDGAFGYSEYKVRSGASTTTREWQYLGSFSTELLFLADKPFNASAFASYDHSYRDNDFFTRTLVESWRYGGRLVWDHEPWLFTAGYQHRGENGSSRYPINQVVLVPVWIGGTPVFVPQTNTGDVPQETVIDEENAHLELRHAATGATASSATASIITAAPTAPPSATEPTTPFRLATANGSARRINTASTPAPAWSNATPPSKPATSTLATSASAPNTVPTSAASTT